MSTVSNRWFDALFLLATALLFFPMCRAEAGFGPDQLVLVVNKNVPEGVRIAKYYMEKRLVPQQNLITVDTSREEYIRREAYDREIAAPVRAFLLKNDPDGSRFACLVLIYGIPLRVSPTRLTPAEETRAGLLRKQLSDMREKKKAEAGKSQEVMKALGEDIERMGKEVEQATKSREAASVDSELALVMEGKYPLEGWLPNKFFYGFRGRDTSGMPQKVIDVCRLDGPAEATVYRIIDDSLYAEEHGLRGKAYFDARWPERDGKDLSPYQIYDRVIHLAATLVKNRGTMPVILDERSELFGQGEAPDAALYCGWYSLAKYVDAFTWARGAVGFHVASAECVTLKNPASTVWCKKMLEKGAAATIGPVDEPFLQSFPDPVIFFCSLMEGHSLAESYIVANPFWSWRMVLIGDPLYRPFKIGN